MHHLVRDDIADILASLEHGAALRCILLRCGVAMTAHLGVLVPAHAIRAPKQDPLAKHLPEA